jgi:argininosuccinate lyase
VALAEKEGITLSQLTFEQYLGLSDKFTEDVHSVFDFEASVEKRNAIGGPSRKGITEQVRYLRSEIAKASE